METTMNTNANTNREGQATVKAAKHSTKDGQKVTRPNTTSRKEIRRETIHRIGHTK
jgi:hypothetical protein